MTTQRPGGHPHGPAENPGHAGHAGHAQTWLAGAGRPAAVPGAPVNVPLELSTTYVAGGALEYARYGNPAWTAFEEVVGGLEGGRALVLSSGMAAVAATLSLVPVGGRVVAPDRGYNGTCALLRALERDGRLSVDWVDVDDTPAMIRALPGAAMVWIESPVNPTLEVPDVAALVAAAQEVRRDGAGPLVVTDNTFATPLLRTPLQDGADIVVHSASKYLAGHSDVVLGVVITGEDRLAERLVEYRMLHGAIAGPAETWLALRGLRTLHLRVERSCANAADLADRLADHPVVGRVRYPGFGAILATYPPPTLGPFEGSLLLMTDYLSAVSGDREAVHVVLQKLQERTGIAATVTGARNRNRDQTELIEAVQRAGSLADHLAEVNAELEERVSTRTRELEQALREQHELVARLDDLVQRDLLIRTDAR